MWDSGYDHLGRDGQSRVPMERHSRANASLNCQHSPRCNFPAHIGFLFDVRDRWHCLLCNVLFTIHTLTPVMNEGEVKHTALVELLLAVLEPVSAMPRCMQPPCPARSLLKAAAAPSNSIFCLHHTLVAGRHCISWDWGDKGLAQRAPHEAC